MRIFIVICCLLCSSYFYGQQTAITYREKKIAVKDTIAIDTVSINDFKFKVFTSSKQPIDSSLYHIDFKTAHLIPSTTLKKQYDSIWVQYHKYPDFLTKSYYQFSPSLIVNQKGGLQKLQSLSEAKKTNTFKPFDGLTTSGSISRGITVGTNQNSVLNSELDLQISGKISDKVSLRASIQDANVPVQQSGYSQNLDEFDQVFIELYSDNWNIRAGDVQLQNTTSFFNRFTKKVQGISIGAQLQHPDSSTDLFAAGALVRGVFARSQFNGQEGNQGPYKLTGPNGELFILIISGSERVYVNGLLLERGENKDYTIDYNAGEVTFNATYPITSAMRISIEYQTTDRNYTRIVAYGGGNYKSDHLKIGAFVYSESDSKNQPLQQSLNDTQKEILANAGDDPNQMVSPSAISDTFGENKTLYRKEIIDGNEVFVFSTNPDDELFNVRFSLVGDNQGDYIIDNVNTINRIYRYVAPIDGIPQGNYAPIIRLFAPVLLQTAVVQGAYIPSEKTAIDFEIAGSKNDLNLFSNLNDNDNDGIAAKAKVNQRIFSIDSSWSLNAYGSFTLLQERFRSIERIYNVEFNRDWNLNNPLGDQQFISTGISLVHPTKGNADYTFEHLNYTENYNGNRHTLLSDFTFNNLKTTIVASALNSQGTLLNSKFYRAHSTLSYSFPKNWIGIKASIESNEEIENETQNFTLRSQRFKAYEAFTGIGDSTKVFVKIGYRHRVNDSVQNNLLDKINSSNTFYLDSKLIQNKNTQLSLFANYRELKHVALDREKEQSLNSRVLFNQKLFKNQVLWNTVFETNSGTLPQQEFTYVAVDDGQGVYTWNDYNNNNVQELEEFEIAQFQDQANYIRVLLPNQVFIKTHQNRLSQTLTLNPNQWRNSDQKTKRFLAHFYNQTSYIIDRKIRRENEALHLNPFDENDNELALNLNFKNVLFFNRGKQRYTTSYTYITSQSKNLLATGLQENVLKTHQLNFVHKFKNTWLLDLKSILGTTESTSENFANRNYTIEGYRLESKLTYLLSQKTQFGLSYLYNDQSNTITDIEALSQQRLSVNFSYANQQKISLNGEFNYFINDFTGNPFSPVGYQLLNGLQPGDNYTWSLLAQKKLTKYLDLNIIYNGRKTETSSTIHTGNIQLRAYF
ncbi:hypothetical protein [Aquimarina rhabdastrellae]